MGLAQLRVRMHVLTSLRSPESAASRAQTTLQVIKPLLPAGFTTYNTTHRRLYRVSWQQKNRTSSREGMDRNTPGERVYGRQSSCMEHGQT